MLKKDAFHWTDEATKAFHALKTALSSPPVLSLPNFSKPFVVETDASGARVGAVLSQDQCPIAYFSQAFKGKTLLLPTYNKNLLALVLAIMKWRSYLLFYKFIVRTDHESLKHLLHQCTSSPHQEEWIAKLMGYNFEIQYRTGVSNAVADAFSRLPYTIYNNPTYVELDNSSTPKSLPILRAISSPLPTWLEELKQEYVTDPDYASKLSQLHSGHLDLVCYTTYNNLHFYKGRLYLSPTSPLRPKILHELHDSSSSGHPGYDKTLHRVRRDFY